MPATPAPTPAQAVPVSGRADPGAMTPAQFAAVLSTLSWSSFALARMLGCDEKLTRKWASGDVAIPPRVGYWLWSLADVMRMHPPPAEWRTVRPPGRRPGRDRSRERKGKSRAAAGKKSI